MFLVRCLGWDGGINAEREREGVCVCRDGRVVVYNESGLQVIRRVYLKRFLLGVGVCDFYVCLQKSRVAIADGDNKDFFKDLEYN